MSIHLRREIEKLKKKLLYLATTVEESVRRSVRSLNDRNADLAKKVIQNDILIDDMEVEIEEDCLKLLALHQPVAIDLRFIVSVLKINSNLERIGDLAVNIAERSVFLASQERVHLPVDFPGMAQKTEVMLQNSLDALVTLDAKLALGVCAADDEVDAIRRDINRQVKKGIREHPDWLNILIHYISIASHLERIADHATNIAEDVIYMVEGDIIRHKAEEYSRS